MPWQTSPYEEETILLAAGQTVSETIHIGNPASLGLLVPPLSNTTLQVMVGSEPDGSDRRALCELSGVRSAAGPTTGNLAITSSEMEAILGYEYLTIVVGTAQAVDRLFTLTRKARETT